MAEDTSKTAENPPAKVTDDPTPSAKIVNETPAKIIDEQKAEIENLKAQNRALREKPAEPAAAPAPKPATRKKNPAISFLENIGGKQDE